MLSNYLKIAFRSLRRKPGYAAINMAGLALGLTCFFFIGAYVVDEWRVDRFHEKGDRVYRVVTDFEVEGQVREQPYTPAILAPFLAADFAEVEAVVRLRNDQAVLRYDAPDGTVRTFREEAVAFVDPSFFEVFSFPLVSGTAAAALTAPNQVVLSEAAAARYFGADPALGKRLRDETGRDFVVVGVMADVPAQSHLTYEVLFSLSTVETGGPTWLYQNWLNTSMLTYVLLRNPDHAPALTAQLPAFLNRHAGPRLQDAELRMAFHLEPLRSLYLQSERGGMARNGSLTNLYLFSLIAFFVLFIAAINFINLTTARSAERAVEIGIRKTVGAERGQLIRQFLGEALGVSLLAFVLALVLIEALWPAFNTLAGKTLTPTLAQRGAYAAVLLALTALVGIVSGLYPAFLLSRFQPAVSLRHRATSPAHQGLRKGLVVVQFGIAIALMACTLIVYNQLRYVQDQPLGFEKEQILVVDFNGDPDVRQRLDVIKQELAALPAVAGITASGSVPGENLGRGGGAITLPNGSEQSVGAFILSVDQDFLEVYQMQTVAGRGFSSVFARDTAAVILNEAAIAAWGFSGPDAAVGQAGEFWGRTHEVVGVATDYHFFSLHRPIEPIVMRIHPGHFNKLSIRLRADADAATLSALEAKWAALVPHQPFTYQFLNEAFDRQYRAEVQFGWLFGLFAGLTLVISCLGLLGLSALTVHQRTKEIGIRKVLGASVAGIVGLLSSGFLKLVLLAFCLASPVAYVLMVYWQGRFAYQAPISVGVFALAGVLALLIAFLTVSYQSASAARANPVDALRYE